MDKSKRILLLGSTGGIGASCYSLLSDCDVTTLTTNDLDLNYPERIFEFDFSNFDLLLNCTGHSKGTYLGFLSNSWENQLSQISVNYISNLFLLKHYASSNKYGKYVWINSVLTDSPRPFHSVYASSKLASKFAIDLIREEVNHIDILEVKLGLVKSNFRYNNFNRSKTKEEVDESYNHKTLECDYVAKKIIEAANRNDKEILLDV